MSLSLRTICLTLGCAVISVLPGSVRAQEPSGLAAAIAIEEAVVEAIARAERSVVAIAMFRRDAERPITNFRDGDVPLDAIPDAWATGVVIDRKGLILTTWHVLKDTHESTRQYIRIAGKPLWIKVKWNKARVKGADPFSDLAVLEIDPTEAATLDLQPIKYGDASKLKKGQIAITLGNPYAIARDGEVSASWGIISNLRRKAPPQPDESPPQSRPTMHHFGTLIQTDAKLNLGTSGGPLLNLRGEMVGLTTSMAALVGYEKSAGYAIAVDDVFRRVVDTLKEGREVEYGFLGVSPTDLSHLERLRGDQGVRIDRIVDGTPAAQKLRSNDVVTHIDGKPMRSTADLMLTIGSQPAGGQVLLRVERFGGPTFVPITLTKNRIVGEQVITAPKPAWRGLRVDFPAALRSLEFAEPIPAGCVIISEVEPASPAAEASLDAGMQITHVEGMPVSTPADFAAALAGRNGPVKLWLRDKQRPFAVVQPKM
jgi:serine protease Do